MSKFSAVADEIHTGQLDANIVKLIFQEDTKEACRINSWSGMIHIHGLASAIGCKINVIYPEFNARIRPLFNCEILPRHDLEKAPMTIMWTRCSVPNSKYWQPNHFVACLPHSVTLNAAEAPSYSQVCRSASSCVSKPRASFCSSQRFSSCNESSSASAFPTAQSTHGIPFYAKSSGFSGSLFMSSSKRGNPKNGKPAPSNSPSCTSIHNNSPYIPGNVKWSPNRGTPCRTSRTKMSQSRHSDSSLFSGQTNATSPSPPSGQSLSSNDDSDKTPPSAAHVCSESFQAFVKHFLACDNIATLILLPRRKYTPCTSKKKCFI